MVRGTPAPALEEASVVMAIEPSVIPWNAPIMAKILVRFFTFRASFKAASTALVPVGPAN